MSATPEPAGVGYTRADAERDRAIHAELEKRGHPVSPMGAARAGWYAALAAQAEAHAAEVAECQERRSETIAMCEQLRAELARLTAERNALRADAERYRWLRDNRVSENDDGEKCVYFWCDFEHYDNVDAAIDAARAQGGTE
jgi:hypothetical protein